MECRAGLGQAKCFWALSVCQAMYWAMGTKKCQRQTGTQLLPFMEWENKQE
jgi:hypothetical protein